MVSLVHTSKHDNRLGSSQTDLEQEVPNSTEEARDGSGSQCEHPDDSKKRCQGRRAGIGNKARNISCDKAKLKRTYVD